MHHPELLERYGWVCFESRTYRTLVRTDEGGLLAELTLTHSHDLGASFFKDNTNIAEMYRDSHLAY